jgi:MFS family permease
MSATIKSRLANSYLIGEIFGMLFFGVLIDRIGRKTGVAAATAFLILGVVLATAAHGKTELGWVGLDNPMSGMLTAGQHVLDDDRLPRYRWLWCRRRVSRLRHDCNRVCR